MLCVVASVKIQISQKLLVQHYFPLMENTNSESLLLLSTAHFPLMYRFCEGDKDKFVPELSCCQRQSHVEAATCSAQPHPHTSWHKEFCSNCSGKVIYTSVGLKGLKLKGYNWDTTLKQCLHSNKWPNSVSKVSHELFNWFYWNFNNVISQITTE